MCTTFVSRDTIPVYYNMNVISGYSFAKTECVLPRAAPYRLKVSVKPSEPMMQVITSWLESMHILPPSKPTLFIHDTRYIPHTRSRKIFIQFEPDVIFNMRKYLIENYKKYDYIVTYDDVILRSCPNARKYVCAACWIPSEDIASVDTSTKQFKLTGLFTKITKFQAKGHEYRLDIYNRQKEIKIPRMFYRSCYRGEPLDEIENNPLFPSKSSKIELFKDAQFSLVIENSSQTNYFSEKIIDCLITKTIPIYWGCPNIHEYFDTTGWIVLREPSFEELQEKLATLTPTHYAEHISTVERNVQNAKHYYNYYTNLNRALKTIPGY